MGFFKGERLEFLLLSFWWCSFIRGSWCYVFLGRRGICGRLVGGEEDVEEEDGYGGGVGELFVFVRWVWWDFFGFGIFCYVNIYGFGEFSFS